MMLRILLVDDYGLLRESLKAQLSTCSDVETVFEASNADEAVEIAAEKRPHIIFMDIDMPGRNPFEAVLDIRAIDPKCKVLFLSGHDYDSYIEKAIEAKADGYIHKRETLDVLKQAIAKVLDGGLFFSESILNRLSIDDGRIVMTNPQNPAIAKLTRRERELLTYLSKGASLKEAAAAMHISYKTADNQKNSLMQKLNIHDRVELAHLAIREGIIKPL